MMMWWWAMKLTGYRWHCALIGTFLLVVTGDSGLAASTAEAKSVPGDLLLMQRGAIVLSHTGYFDNHMSPPCIIDGTTDKYWASSEGFKARPYPHYFIIELDRAYALQRLAVSNVDNDEPDFPGVSAREVVFMGSTESAETGFEKLATIQGKQYGRAEVTLSKPVNVRWLKVLIKSNHGNEYSTELSELEAYGKPVGDIPTHPDLSGVYMTNYGLLRIAVNSDRVEGCYDLDAGYIWGTTDGRTLNIDWVEHKGKEKGKATLVLAGNGSFLSGLWWENGVVMGPWYGQRQPQPSEIECEITSAASGVGINRKRLFSGN